MRFSGIKHKTNTYTETIYTSPNVVFSSGGTSVFAGQNTGKVAEELKGTAKTLKKKVTTSLSSNNFGGSLGKPSAEL